MLVMVFMFHVKLVGTNVGNVLSGFVLGCLLDSS